MEEGLICGCMVDGDNIPCVFDDPEYTADDCNYAKQLHAEGKGRDDCKFWKPAPPEERCAWTQDESVPDLWETSCFHAFSINDGTPSDNDMKFCCFCGLPIEEDAANEDE